MWWEFLKGLIQLELLVIGLFVAVLILCLVFDAGIICALTAGYVIFFVYALKKGFRPRDIAVMSLKGMSKVKNILITFIFIGMLTALWRASGTIAEIITLCAGAIPPAMFIMLSFLLTSLVSFLMGTAFGSSATAGIVCMSMGSAMGLSPFWMGGAILAGAFFGDRCSPISTAALLVSELTDTDIYSNVKGMMRTAFVPLLAACAVYLAAGILGGGNATATDVRGIFEQNFVLHPSALAPALLILVLAALHVHVRMSIFLSAACAGIVCLLLQKASPGQLVEWSLFGYSTADSALQSMLGGGGIFSMVNPAIIICISSSYSGIFEKTGLLTGIKEHMQGLSRRISPFGCTALTAAITCMVSCNQTLATILTHQLCRQLGGTDDEFAMDLENSAIVIAPLVPWSIAAAVPLTTIGADLGCIAAACYLYFIPIWHFMARREKGYCK